MPSLVNLLSFIRIRCKLVKSRDSKLPSFYKEMYARGQVKFGRFVISRAKADSRFTLVFPYKAQSRAMGNTADT